MATQTISIDSLKTAGAFTGRPVEKEIEWNSGGEDRKATVYVRQLSYATAVADIVSGVEKTDHIAARIAASICDADGHAIFTPGDITGDADPERGPLCSSLTIALLSAIGEVNGKKKTS
jgi:hypothetical protein